MTENNVSNVAKINALFKEKPFLKKHVCKERVNEVHIERMDAGLLTENRGLSIFTDFLALLDEEGNILARVGSDYIPHRWGLWKRWIHGGLYHHSIDIALSFLINEGDIDKVHYVLSRSGCVLTLYKLPKKNTILELITETEDRAQEAIRAEIATIDDITIAAE